MNNMQKLIKYKVDHNDTWRLRVSRLQDEDWIIIDKINELIDYSDIQQKWNDRIIKKYISLEEKKTI